VGSLVVEGNQVFGVGGTYRQPTILVSDDRGHTFTTWKVPDLPPYGMMPGIRDVHVEGDIVWIVGEWGGIARTVDKGVTWKLLPATSNQQCLYSVMRGVDRRLWILGDHGLVLRSRSTKPNATQFDKVDNKSTARMLYMFVDGNDVWLLDSGGMLQRNTGSGFEEVPLKAMRTPRPLCALVRTPKRTLILLGDGGLVLRSTNDGASWKKISVESRNDLEKLVVTPYGIFVVGAKGSLLVSHDDGKSFQGLDTGTTAHLWSIAPIDGELLIGGEGGQLWRVARPALGQLMHDHFESSDSILAGLALRMRDGDEGADLVLEDALREREMWW
jgi:photosystem II stability/assembly factor-like uncharacterized protein